MDNLSDTIDELAHQLRGLVAPAAGQRRKKRAAHRARLEKLELGDQKVRDYLGGVQADLLGLTKIPNILRKERPKIEE